jgi:hypothetical protein
MNQPSIVDSLVDIHMPDYLQKSLANYVLNAFCATPRCTFPTPDDSMRPGDLNLQAETATYVCSRQGYVILVDAEGLGHQTCSSMRVGVSRPCPRLLGRRRPDERLESGQSV